MKKVTALTLIAALQLGFTAPLFAIEENIQTSETQTVKKETPKKEKKRADFLTKRKKNLILK